MKHDSLVGTRLRALCAAGLSVALAGSLSPIGSVPVAVAQTAPMHSPCASADEIAAMLDAGTHAEGEAIVVVDDAAASAGSVLDGAEEIMEAGAGAYEQATGEEVESPAGVRIERVVHEGADTAALMSELAADPRVLSVEPNYVHEVPDVDGVADEQTESSAMTARSDAAGGAQAGSASSYSYDQDYDMTPWQWMSNGKTVMTMPDTQAVEDAGVHAPDWNDAAAATDQTDCIVAVLDTGVDYNHPDLQGRIYQFSEELQAQLGCGEWGAHFGDGGIIGKDPMDDHGHGTHCAGNVVAAWNGAGTGGVATGVQVMALKVSDASYVYPDSALLSAYAFVGKAADAGVPVRVTSNSYGGSVRTTAQNIALAQLGEHGVVSVFASGNERADVDEGGESNDFPCNPYTIDVDASRPDGAPSAFTCYGLKTDLHSPGASIMSTVPWFARQYFAPADAGKGAAVYASKASGNGAWTGAEGGIVVSGAAAGTVPDSPNDALVDTPGEQDVSVAQAGAEYSFDGDGQSLELTLGKVQVAAEDEEGNPVTSNEAGIVYLDFKLPVADLADAPYASVCAYIDGYGGAWSYVPDEDIEGKPCIDTHLMAKVKDSQGKERWLQDYDGRCYNEGAWQHVSFDFDKSLARAVEYEEEGSGETYTYAPDEDGNLQMRLRFQGVAGVTFKEGTRIYLDCLGVGHADTQAVLPYSIWDGTSMATPIAAGCVAVIAKGMGEGWNADAPAASAARLCELTKACVAQDGSYMGRCAQRGRLDLSLLGSDGKLDLNRAAPVIEAAAESDGKAAIEGFAFGTEAGTLSIDGKKVSTSSWTQGSDGTSRIEFSWPSGMNDGVKTITVTNKVSGKTADKYLLLTAPGASSKLYEEEIPMDDCPMEASEYVMQMTGFDGRLYLLLEDNLTAQTRIVSYDIAGKSWTSCTKEPFDFARASMTFHDGKLLVAGTHTDAVKDSEGRTVERTETCAMFSYDPGAGAWTELDAANFPVASALIDCEGELLVVGDMPEAADDEDVAPTGIARWELRSAGTEQPYQITADDIVCKLSGVYQPTKKDVHDSISYPPLVAVQGGAIYIADPSRLDAGEFGIGFGMERAVRTAPGIYKATDYTGKLRYSDEDGSDTGGIKIDRGKFAFAAGQDGPVLVGATVYANGKQVTADTVILKDGAKTLVDLGKRFSASTLENMVACVYDGKLYVVASPIDEAVGYRLRATSLTTASQATVMIPAANPLKVKGKTVKLKAKKLKKRSLKVASSKAFKVTNNKSKAKITYTKTSGKAKLKVAKNGKITVKKGLKKGTYKLRVKAVQKKTASWKAKTVKNIVVRVKVS